MHVAFDSSHVAGDFSSGRLTVGITRDDPAAGISIYDDINFSVPVDFHVHNDGVAAALLPLVGRAYSFVRFNFGISQHCADVLRAYYALDEIGPVDPSLAPRQPGRHVGLSFSGALDSLTVWAILRRLLGDDFKLIHVAFGGGYERETVNALRFRPDVVCASDFRRKGYEWSGRFMAAVPLLFAEYLDLESVAFGHVYIHGPPLHIEPLVEGQQPAFLQHDAVLQAAGVNELHLLRALMPQAVARVQVALVPELIEDAMLSSGRPGSIKYAARALMAREAFELRSSPLPAFLQTFIPAERKPKLGQEWPQDLYALYFLRHYGPATAALLVRGVERISRGRVDALALEFPRKYNQRVAAVVPPALREPYQALLHDIGIEPYSSDDFLELEAFRQLAILPDCASPAPRDAVSSREMLCARRHAQLCWPIRPSLPRRPWRGGS